MTTTEWLDYEKPKPYTGLVTRLRAYRKEFARGDGSGESAIYKVTGVDFEGKRHKAKYFRHLAWAEVAFHNIEFGSIWRDNPFSGWPEGTFETTRRSDKQFWLRIQEKKK